MEKQQKPTVYLTKTQPKMNLMALLFFLMGALPLYAQFNGGGQGSYLATVRQVTKYLKVALTAALVAAIAELVSFAQ